jgi:hypothetical protein
VAHDGCVVRQPDVLGVVLVILALRGSGLFLVDNEGALHVDLDIAGVQDRLVDVALRGCPPGPSRYST